MTGWSTSRGTLCDSWRRVENVGASDGSMSSRCRNPTRMGEGREADGKSDHPAG